MSEAGSPAKAAGPGGNIVQIHFASFAKQSQVEWFSLTELSPIARLVAELLDETKRRFRECWLTNRRIASVLNISLASVQRALKELSLKGFVSVVVNYGLRARRAIQLLWRTPAVAPVEAAHAADVPADDYQVCRGREPGEDDDLGEVPAPKPRPTPKPAPKPDPKPKPTPPKANEAEQTLIDKAEAKFGPCFTAPVLAAIEKFGFAWVSQAIDDTSKGRPWSWLLGKLKGWEENRKPQRPAKVGMDWAAIHASNEYYIHKWFGGRDGQPNPDDA